MNKYIINHHWDRQRARAAFFILDQVFSAYMDSDFLHGVDLTPLFVYYEHKNFYQFMEDEKLSLINKGIFEDFIRGGNLLDVYINTHKSLTEQLQTISKSYKNLQKKDASELLKLLQNHISISRQWWYYGVLLEDKGRVIKEEVVPYFAQIHSLSMNSAQEAVSVLAHPEEMSMFNEERKIFLELCAYALQNNLNKDKVTNSVGTLLADLCFIQKCEVYIEKFFWIESDFYKYKPITYKSLATKVIGEIANKSIEEIRQLLNELPQAKVQLELRRAQLKSELTFNELDHKYLYFTKRIVEWMDYRKFGMMVDIYFLTQLLEEVGCRLGLSYDEICLYTLAETIDLLQGKGKRDRQLEEKRENGEMAVFQKGMPPTLYYEDSGSTLFNLLNDAILIGEDFKGIVASKGLSDIVEGIVYIVHDPKIEKFQAGTILVTSMTRVEFLPLMRKAVAIITDEGGIACHAAIVSRELGMPCIIATKKATQILKTGMKVQMDLKSGNITVLNND